MSATKFQSAVFIDSYEREAVRPHVYVKGGDYVPDRVAEAQLVKTLGIEFRTLTHRPGTSSTGVIERVREAFMSGGKHGT